MTEKPIEPDSPEMLLDGPTETDIEKVAVNAEKAAEAIRGGDTIAAQGHLTEAQDALDSFASLGEFFEVLDSSIDESLEPEVDEAGVDDAPEDETSSQLEDKYTVTYEPDSGPEDAETDQGDGE